MANLTQLKILESISGFVAVDKPIGIAFSTVVKSIKRRFNLVKVGHGGSLDAMASGLLMLLVGDANRYVGDLMGADRAYEGTMRLGLATDTHDIYGAAVGGDIAAVEGLTAEHIATSANEFRGDIFQTEPSRCSVRREGSAAYEVADTGAHEQFLAHVYRFVPGVLEKGNDGIVRLGFSLMASKGVLVRTLANDFGTALGCGAALETLRRTRVGKFSVDDAIPFASLLETDMGDFQSCVMPLSALR